MFLGEKAATTPANSDLFATLSSKKKATLTEFYGISGAAKVAPAVKFLQEQLASGKDKILVFAHHIEVPFPPSQPLAHLKLGS